MPSQEEHAAALKREMEALAAEIKVDGVSLIRLSRKTAAFLTSLSERAIELSTHTADDALTKVCQTSRLMEMLKARLATKHSMALPSAGGIPRVCLIANKLISSGDREIIIHSIIRALTAFDDMQTLTMSELWQFPDAMYVSLCEAYMTAAERLIDGAEARILAEKWAYGEGGKQSGTRNMPLEFYERAVQLASELEKPELRAKATELLARMDLTVETCVKQAYGIRAINVMRIDNTLSVKREIENADWRKCFEKISRAEIELRNDPSGTYPNMTDDSRDAVRHALSIIAKKARATETVVAKCAVNSAGKFSVNDPRGGVCWWIYDDAGAAELVKRLGVKGKIPKKHIDPSGVGLIISFVVIAHMIAVFAGFISSDWLWAVLFYPPAWGLTRYIISRITTRAIKPDRLLRMNYESIPKDAGTIVAVPAIIPSKERAKELVNSIEALGCLDKDDMVSYMLLGDFPDADEETMTGDSEIIKYVESEIDRLNNTYGQNKFLYAHRRREFAEKDKIYRGKSRKRGAIMELCKRIIDGDYGNVKYIITLDADTKLLPNTVNKLISTIAHPLNAIRAVLQPSVEIDPSSGQTEFSQLFSGDGGMNAYSAVVSNMYEDVCGVGTYCGKGIIDVRAFYEALNGKLDEDRILSHDLIEGMLTGCEQVSDVMVFDGYPSSYAKYLKRLSRWTRGDWQLLKELWRKGLGSLNRFRIIDNLMSSLEAPALFVAFILSVWLDSRGAFSVAVIFALIEGAVSRFMGDKGAFRRSCVRTIGMLPSEAYTRLDAAIRALYRTFVSKKKLLEWVTAADATGGDRSYITINSIAAMLLLPGLFMGAWTIPCLALGVLFIIMPYWISDMGQEKAEEALTRENAEAVKALSFDTWKFFKRYVTAETNYLPPDNVQIDPDTGVAMRTSPTNIGMYMLSCLSAKELKLISDDEFISRVIATTDTIDKLEKWHGHLYNWYDITNLSPLKPRYVSSVDSGNLAACLLTCSRAVSDISLSHRLENMAKSMDFSRLYDAERELFHIGADIEKQKLSSSRYDLLASESRILSYTAIMLGYAGIDNWLRLGRPTSLGALMSWSGTMFEYFMPSIFMKSAENTLISRTLSEVYKSQKAFADARNRPWGVSESGYYAFDMRMNYQYKAFGMRDLALGGQASQNVIAPYASSLALEFCPNAAANNMRGIVKSGYAGEFGMYEAVDFSRREPRIVKSYMSHHQGMALCAMCNVLTGGAIRRYFSEIPEARAINMLLNERAASRIKLKRIKAAKDSYIHGTPVRPRLGRPMSRLCDSALLCGGEASAFVTSAGDMAYSKNGIYANRFYGEVSRRRDAITTEISVNGKRRKINGEKSKSVFEPGLIKYSGELEEISYEMSLAISPENGALIRQISLENKGGMKVVTLEDSFDVSLMDIGETRAHPAFHRLFMISDLSREGEIVYTRKSREGGLKDIKLTHSVSGGDEISYETDWMKYRGRLGKTADALHGESGAQIDPCSAIRVKLALAGGEKRTVAYSVNLTSLNDSARRVTVESAERAIRLSQTCTSSIIAFTGLDIEKSRLIDRLAAILIDTSLINRTSEKNCAGHIGIPSDMPSVLVTLDSAEGFMTLRDLIRARDYCMQMGAAFQLIIINDRGNDYAQPVRDGIDDILASCGLADKKDIRGGVFVLRGDSLTELERESVKMISCLTFRGEKPFWTQVRQKLLSLEYPQHTPYELVSERGEIAARGIYAEGCEIAVTEDAAPSAPWSNIIATDDIGMLITERGGGFIWYKNSRIMRITPFDNDPAKDGFGFMPYIADTKEKKLLRALPADIPATPFIVNHRLWESEFSSEGDGIRFETTVFAAAKRALCVMVHMRNTSKRARDIEVTCFVNWLMGVDQSDYTSLTVWKNDGALFAKGKEECVSYLVCPNRESEDIAPKAKFLGLGGVMKPDGLFDTQYDDGGAGLKAFSHIMQDGEDTVCFILGAEDCEDGANSAAVSWKSFDSVEARKRAKENWEGFSGKMRIHTDDKSLDTLVNGFLLKQVIDGRIRARAGYYQAGGAYGFRDQLQDMLALMPYDETRVRDHIIYAAGRQFLGGDVMHWWHHPYRGVRTRISDDMLFMPFIAARYVKSTGDLSILDKEAGYLRNIEIPEGRDDIYAEMSASGEEGALFEHCMRAIRRAKRLGAHGLLLMGAGDWNDGMNKIGAKGKGESVWLSMFFVACANEFSQIMPECEDKAWLIKSADEVKRAIEACAWDGLWYLRAFDDDGNKLGGIGNDECEIDIIAQAWSVIAGLDAHRSETAMKSARDMLVDASAGVIKLLKPPFNGATNAGYIASYPIGVRENGGQYTHAACWYLLATSLMGDAKAVKEALNILLPCNHDESVYRVEPYVLAGDVYSMPPYAGRGGWTWYTGAASWFIVAIRSLTGYTRRGNKVRLIALKGMWETVTVEINYGKSKYRLISSSEGTESDFIELVDDNQKHEIHFVQRTGRVSFSDTI